jgi:hypothetical protein
MTEFDEQVRWRVYQTFEGTGRPPAPTELASALGVNVLAVEEALSRLHRAHAIVLAPGSHHVWMAHPFSAVPTAYPVEMGGCRYWANCAWDALGIPAMLGRDANAATVCPDCNERVTIRVEGGSATPEDAVVHFLVPARDFWADIGFT